jgi:hypothetical protein
MTLVALFFAAAASTPLVDADLQPECRARCEEAYAAERAACEGRSFGADECLDAADDRHQECIDRCND